MKRLHRYLTAKNLLYFGFFCILLFPWLFTRTWGLFHFDANTGVIGDTIGGITGPISGFLGAALVYLALKEQIKANKIITDQFREQKEDELYRKTLLYLSDLVKMLREDIKDFEIVAELTTQISRSQAPQKDIVTYKGTEAIAFSLKTYSQDLGHDKNVEENFNAHLIQIKHFLQNTLHLIKLCKNSNISISDRDYLVWIILEVYSSKLRPFLKQNEMKRAGHLLPCNGCNNRHNGIPEYIYGLYDQINIELESLKIAV